MAQPWQRARGAAQRQRQSVHSGPPGQRPQTWQRLGHRAVHWRQGECIGPIYWAALLLRPPGISVSSSPAAPSTVPGLDPVASARWASAIRLSSPWLHEEVGARMLDRLQWFREMPKSWLDWEPIDGGLAAHRQLRERLPDAECLVQARHLPQALAATREAPRLGWNPLQWRRASAPRELSSDSKVQMVWANMALHREPSPEGLMRQWHRLVDTGGFLMFSCFGPDTLRELRAVYAAQGWPAPSHDFVDMHDLGDMLVHAGFAEPVMDMERIVLTYSGAEPLLAELRGLGRNLNAARWPNCRGRAWRRQLVRALEEGLPRDDQGRLSLTFEVVYGHAFKAAPKLAVAPNATVGVDDFRAMLKGSRR